MFVSVARRLVPSFASLILVSFLCFALLRAAPGNYFTFLRLQPGSSAQTLEALKAEADPRTPLIHRYAEWVGGILHGNLGVSVAYQMPVSLLIADRILNTLALAGTGMGLAWAAGLVLGSLRGFPATVVRMFSSFLWSIPDPVLALLMMVAAFRFHKLPPLEIDDAGGAASWSHWIGLLHQLVLPALTVGLLYLPLVIRHVQSGLQAAQHAPAVEAAEAHGLPAGKVLRHYLLPEASNSLLSLLGLSLGSLISASLFVEVLFGWPGLGQLLLSAILMRDTNIVVAGVFASAAILIAGTVVSDLLLWCHDPRLRASVL